MKLNVILHVTTSCNYDCSYCDVIKDKKNISIKNRQEVISFIQNNKQIIHTFKFFGGEPLLRFSDIKFIIDNTYQSLGKRFEIVTNTTLLNDEIGEYFEKYFEYIFLSIDTENKFDFQRVSKFINQYNLEKKVYFNLVINPNLEASSLEQFQKLYDMGMRGFNILPVYYTKIWKKKNLKDLAHVMKYILDLSLQDSSLRLYGFQKVAGEESNLYYGSIFCNTDGRVYYSDMVSTFMGKPYKDDLFIGHIQELKMIDLYPDAIETQKNILNTIEKKFSNSIEGQVELQKIMNYFSLYLSKKYHEK